MKDKYQEVNIYLTRNYYFTRQNRMYHGKRVHSLRAKRNVQHEPLTYFQYEGLMAEFLLSWLLNP